MSRAKWGEIAKCVDKPQEQSEACVCGMCVTRNIKL